MNPGRFYIPNYMGMGNIPISNPMLGYVGNIPRKIGIFNRITSGIRSINWSGLLTNANKTLDVVNQTIPLVRQAGPMLNNMKSMLKIAKAFGSETTTNNRNRFNNQNKQYNMIDKNIVNHSIDNNVTTDVILNQKKEEQSDNAPNFFV